VGNSTQTSIGHSQKLLLKQFASTFERYQNCAETIPGEIFYTLREAQVLIEKWRLEYNTFRPHSPLNYRPPAPEAYLH
jgi:transposase InsO family protein